MLLIFSTATMLQALKAKDSFVQTQGQTVPLSPLMAVFGTMNPSYPPMRNLPDNLQNLLWPVAMTIPDIAQIAEVILIYTGFKDCKVRPCWHAWLEIYDHRKSTVVDAVARPA